MVANKKKISKKLYIQNACKENPDLPPKFVKKIIESNMEYEKGLVSPFILPTKK